MTAKATIDRYGHVWLLPLSELCPECKQPDNCGDCNHEPLSDQEAEALGAMKVIHR